MNNRWYEGQALAIAMVVVIVSSIIGVSVYSRVMKDKSLALQEQASAEALEISDIILNYVIQVPIDDVISSLTEENLIAGSSYLGSDSTLETYFASLGITDFDPDNLGICSLSESDSNEYYLKVQQADENSYYEIPAGQVRSFLVGDLTVSEGCSASVTLSIQGDTQTGFTVTKIYKSDSDTVKEYTFDDVISYCFSDDGVTCNNTSFVEVTGSYDDPWTKFQADDSITVPFEDDTYSGYYLDEVRIKALGGTVGMAYSLVDCGDSTGLRLISIQAGANCNGVYRGKEVLVPESKWSTTIFDYVIFNGEGRI